MRGGSSASDIFSIILSSVFLNFIITIVNFFFLNVRNQISLGFHVLYCSHVMDVCLIFSFIPA